MNPDGLSEHGIVSGGQPLNYYLRTPKRLAPIESRLLLITLSMEWKSSLFAEPYRQPPDAFLSLGHYALSFDTPCHGERTEPFGTQLHGYCNALQGGFDPFEQVVGDARAIMDDCVRRGHVLPGNIVVCGASRGGYMALRLLADDARVARAAGFAPVTDWRYLHEFEEIKDSETISALQLRRYVGSLKGKPVFFAIGSHDSRVSTLSCCKFYAELVERNLAHGYSEALVDFYVTDDAGHTMGKTWYDKGTQFLLSGVAGTDTRTELGG